MALITDVERHEKGLELKAAQEGAISQIESLQVVLSGLVAMKLEMAENQIFTIEDQAEVDAAAEGIKNKIRTDILDESPESDG